MSDKECTCKASETCENCQFELTKQDLSTIMEIMPNMSKLSLAVFAEQLARENNELRAEILELKN